MLKHRVRSGFIAMAVLSIGSTAFAEEAPIRIGVIGPVTGKSSQDMGESIVGGARVFLKDINQIGGILGRRVELVERDDQASPEIGVKMAKELIEVEKVQAVVGFANTGVAVAAAKVFQDAKIPLIVSASTGVNVTKQYMPPHYASSYIFRTTASDAVQPVSILNDLIDRRHITKIAVLHDTSPYGRSGMEGIVAHLASRKLSAVSVGGFDVGSTDMSAQLASAKAAGAQAIVLHCLAPEAAVIVKQAASAGMKMPIVGSWTLSQKTFLDMAGDAAEGVRMPVTYVENADSGASNQFALDYRKVNHVPRIPSAVSAAQTYDALRLLTLAMFQARSTDGTKVKEALENLQTASISTVVTRYAHPFSPTDHEAIAINMVMIGEVKQGGVGYAYKEDATRALIKRVKKKE